MTRIMQRFAALCVTIVFSVALFYVGREHQVFLDNKTIEVDGQNFRALKFVRVTVWTNSGGEMKPVELMPRDRDVAKVVGPSFNLKVEIMDEFGEEVEKVIERKLTPGFSKDVMLSMPLLAAEREDYILPPPTVQNQAPPQESEWVKAEEDLVEIPH